MSWWKGYGAPGYSREVERASVALRAAEKALQATLQAEYPLGAYVRVVHDRGAFCGYVEGWDYNGSRVMVTNERSGKSSKWWAVHVEIIESAERQEGQP